MRPKTIATRCAEIIEDKKGFDITILDLKKISTLTKYFVICSCTSDKHVKTVAGELRVKMKEENVRSFHVDGLSDLNWVVIDYIDVIVHVFLKEMRDYYRLEDLWGDAVRVAI